MKLHSSFAGERAANQGLWDLPRPCSRLRCEFCAGVLSVAFFSSCYTFLLFADKTAQRDHAWITLLSQRLIKGINEKVEHVVRNGDPSGYPGCVNLSFAYVEGESLLMALKVSEFGMLS